MEKNQPIFQVVSEYLKFPFELKVDYFILLFSSCFHFRNFSSIFCFNQKKIHKQRRAVQSCLFECVRVQA